MTVRRQEILRPIKAAISHLQVYSSIRS